MVCDFGALHEDGPAGFGDAEGADEFFGRVAVVFFQELQGLIWSEGMDSRASETCS